MPSSGRCQAGCLPSLCSEFHQIDFPSPSPCCCWSGIWQEQTWYFVVDIRGSGWVKCVQYLGAWTGFLT